MLVLGAISEFFVGIGIWICVGIYNVAAVVFKLFLILAQGKLVDSSSYNTLITSFNILIGVVMLFVIAFSLLKGMINPDDSSKGTSAVKKIIINLITSSIIVSVLPTIFTFAFDFQTSIFDKGTIGAIFNGSITDDSFSKDSKQYVETGAYKIVNGVFTAFFTANPEEALCDSITSPESFQQCQSNVTAQDEKYYYSVDENGKGEMTKGTPKLDEAMASVDKIGNFGVYSAFAQNADDGQVDFNFLLCLVAGAVLIYIGISYSIDMGVRLVKLVFYQAIAPIPIFLRIIPNGKMSESFNQWLKITITCYVEVFIRIFILYFCVFLCNEMMKSDFLSRSVYQYGTLLAVLTKAATLLGIIMFMKQAPKLISSIIGIDSGNMKLGIREKLADGGLFTAGAMAGGGLTAGVRNAFAAGSAAKNNWGEVKDKKGKEKAMAIGKALGSSAKVPFSGASGFVSGAARGGKAGWNAKSGKDMQNAASAGARGAVAARETRAAYKASHTFTGEEHPIAAQVGNALGIGSMIGHAQDAKRNVSEWAGVGVVSSSEAEWYNSFSNAMDSAHSQVENAYKGKPPHNKLKEDVTQATTDLNIARRDVGEWEKLVKSTNAEYTGFQNFKGQMSAQQTARFNELKNIRQKAVDAQNHYEQAERNLKNIKDELTAHEAGEIGKKINMPYEALNQMINAKTKYYDVSQKVFDDEFFKSFIDENTSQGYGEQAKMIVEKIKKNETVNMDDLAVDNPTTGKREFKVDMKSIESMIDRANIKSKNLAAEKRVEVAHAKALKEEKKSDGK